MLHGGELGRGCDEAVRFHGGGVPANGTGTLKSAQEQRGYLEVNTCNM